MAIAAVVAVAAGAVGQEYQHESLRRSSCIELTLCIMLMTLEGPSTAVTPPFSTNPVTAVSRMLQVRAAAFVKLQHAQEEETRYCVHVVAMTKQALGSAAASVNVIPAQIQFPVASRLPRSLSSQLRAVCCIAECYSAGRSALSATGA
eukprot:1118-Heterococcus_DN1.PRE.2